MSLPNQTSWFYDSMISTPGKSKRFVLLVIRVSSLCVTNIKDGIMPIYVYINKLLHFLVSASDRKAVNEKKKKKRKSKVYR